MADRPARPPTQLQYLCWDGTDPKDSIELAKDLAKSFRCINLLDDSPSGEFGVFSSPKIFEPCGTAGTDISLPLWLRGMFEFPRTFFKPVHHNAGSDLPAILQYSGHGIPGFMFSESQVLVATSKPMNFGGFTPGAGLAWNFVNEGWDNASTRVLIFSACRQLAGLPQQFLWSSRMRGAGNRIHLLLGYRRTAPLAPTSADINRVFVSNLRKGQTFINAWRAAHVAVGLPGSWAVLAFKSSVGDRMDHWVRDGSLPKEPAVDEDILYLDEDNRSGRAVTKPSPDFDMDMTFVMATATPLPNLIAGNVVPPWTILKTGTFVNLRLKFLTDSFTDGDKVWLAALQVRPDYPGPFDIEALIKFVDHGTLIGNGTVTVFGRLHDQKVHPKDYKPDDYGDLYEFTINRKGMPFASIDSTFKTLTIPMLIGGPPNDHLPIFYLMVRVERGSREFGIPTHVVKGTRLADQKKMIEESQFCVFLAAGSG